MKPILCLDFDGVVHLYISGWQGAATVGDGPVPGVFDFIERAMEHFTIAIFSSRSNQDGGLYAMKTWLLLQWGLHLCDAGQPNYGARAVSLCQEIQWPLEKPQAFLTIDDRALCFGGLWSAYNPVELLKFKPWNKQ